MKYLHCKNANAIKSDKRQRERENIMFIFFLAYYNKY